MHAPQVNTKAGKSGIFVLAFTTTLREGLETAVFITGSNTASGAASIPLAGLVGVICGLIVGMILFYTCAWRVLTCGGCVAGSLSASACIGALSLNEAKLGLTLLTCCAVARRSPASPGS